MKGGFDMGSRLWVHDDNPPLAGSDWDEINPKCCEAKAVKPYKPWEALDWHPPGKP